MTMDSVSCFRATAKRLPDKTALIFNGEHFTYRELDVWSDRIASSLGGRLADGQTVGVAMRRSPGWIAVLMGIWKAGGVYVPLDLDNPGKRIEAISKDCGLSLIIRDGHIGLRPDDIPMLMADQMGKDGQPSYREKDISGDSTAYIIYTSGTTGTPKGVPSTHRQAVLMGRLGRRSVFHLKEGGRMLQLAGLGFSVSLVEVTTCLFNGGCMVMATEDERHDPRRLAGLLGREDVECAFIPPALLAAMPYADLPKLKTIVVGGEGVNATVIDRWKHGRRLVNAYGFTENTVHVMNGVYGSGTPANDIGTPVPGVSAYIVDESLNPVPDGTAGELCISGRQLTSGYWKHPELSEGKFVANPFATEDDRRKGRNLTLYRSGDKAMRQPNGRYLYLGRIDGQVKIRGIRIEPGEIERHLNSYPGVMSSVVLPKEHNGKKMLVAYLQTEHPIDEEKISAYLEVMLPEHMCPKKIEALDEFPLTPNGKTDRNRLPEPDWSHPGMAKDRPASPTEEAVARLWREMLGVEQVGRNDDFVALGGDSISVMLMANELEKTFGIRVDTAEIHRRKKLSALSEYIDGKLSEKAGTHRDGDAGTYEPPAPLRNLLVDCLSSGERNEAYKLAVFIPWEKGLDVPALQEAWSRIMHEQDAMRIFFKRESDGRHRVHTSPVGETNIPVKEIRTDSFPEEAAVLYRQALDPKNPPLHRECLYRLTDGSYVLVSVIHHLITDGWSIRLLVRTLKAYYRQKGNSGKGRGETYSYREYALWYGQCLESPSTKRKLQFWKSYMAGCPELSFTGNAFNDGPAKQQGYALSLPMYPKSAEALECFCRKHSVTPFVACLCVYQILLMKYAGQTDFAVGAAFTDRRKAELYGLMGYLTTLLPVRAIADEHTFAGMTGQMSQNIVLLSSNSLPLDMISNAIGQDGKDGRRHPVRFTFGLEDLPTNLTVPDEWTTASPFDLSLSICRNGGRYSYHYQYAADGFTRDFIKAFSESFDVALLYLAAHPEKDIATCPLLPPEKIAEIVSSFGMERWNRPRPDVVAGFGKAAARNPGHDAFVWNGRRCSYGELQDMARSVAAAVRHKLELMGEHGTSVPVGIRLEGKRYLPAGILGILKSGNCYVPLDAGLPRERLEFILKDAGIRLVVCDAALAGEGYGTLPMEEALAYGGKEAADASIRPEMPAYIIYTSGTTGQPKGTPVSHASLALFAESQSRLFGLRADSHVLQYASMGFDASVLEIFPALISGSTLVLPTEEERKDAGRLLDLLEEEKVNCALIPPALLAILPYRELPHLRVLAVGGESTPAETMRKWAKGRTLLNEYGPTENTAVTTCARFLEGCQPNNIGRPLPGVSCYVVDKDLNLMPDGAAGELCIGGLQLTAGYLRRDILNKEKFVENPFVLPEDKAHGMNTMIYRSGDKAVRAADGSFLYIGRMDSQIKLRGFRIELDEISRQLERHPDVLQALAVLKEAKDGHTFIAAYIVAKNGRPTLPGELDRYLCAYLPAYMVPSAWRMVDGFPMTLNGKIDKPALPEAFPTVTGSHVPPADKEEEALERIASKLLEVEPVGVTADLFDIGLTSLQAMELVVDARERGIPISTTDLYRGRCIRNILARHKGDHFYWQGNSGRADRPLMVIIGYPSFNPGYDGFVDTFKDGYDFFVFESFLDTLQGEPCCNASELVRYYHRTVQQELGGKDVYAVTGFCLGGELAMLLAAELRTDGWPEIKALVIDGFLFRDKQLPLTGRNTDGAGKVHDRIISEIIQSLPQPAFGGEMAVCLALRPYKAKTDGGQVLEIPEIQRRNREDWKRTYPHALYCEVDADHDGIMEKEHMNTLYAAMQKHWADGRHQEEGGHGQ